MAGVQQYWVGDSHTHTHISLLSSVMQAGQTALMHAARAGASDAVAALASGGAKLEATDRQGNTALLLAASRGHTTTIATLLRAGANVHVVNKVDIASLACPCVLSRRITCPLTIAVSSP